MELTTALNGHERVIGFFDDLYFDSRKQARVSELIGAHGVDSTLERFDNQRDPDGQPWLPSLRAQVQNGETLRDKGRLMSSITYVPLPDGVEWGTNVMYAPVMHNGAVIKAKNTPLLRFMTALGWRSVKSVTIPSRPFLGINEADIDEIGDIITRELSNDR